MLRRHVRGDGPPRALFVVPDLTVGGAKQQVATLLPAIDGARSAPSVLCLGRTAALSAEPAAEQTAGCAQAGVNAE